MAVTKNPVPAMPSLNCVGKIQVATKDGEFIAYQKPETGYVIIAFDFEALEGTTGRSGRTWVTLNAEQFNPTSDNSEFANWQKQNFDKWFLPPEGSSDKKIAVLSFLTKEEGEGWMGKLEQYYDSATGLTDVQSIAREISSRIDGKIIGYQMVQGSEKNDAGERVKTDQYVIGSTFFDPEAKYRPKGGQDTERAAF